LHIDIYLKDQLASSDNDIQMLYYNEIKFMKNAFEKVTKKTITIRICER